MTNIIAQVDVHALCVNTKKFPHKKKTGLLTLTWSHKHALRWMKYLWPCLANTKRGTDDLMSLCCEFKDKIDVSTLMKWCGVLETNVLSYGVKCCITTWRNTQYTDSVTHISSHDLIKWVGFILITERVIHFCQIHVDLCQFLADLSCTIVLFWCLLLLCLRLYERILTDILSQCGKNVLRVEGMIYWVFLCILCNGCTIVHRH